MLPASEHQERPGPSSESEDTCPLRRPRHTAKTKQRAGPLPCACRDPACRRPRPRQVPVSGGGDAPVPADHPAVSEQDASWGDQGGRRQGVPPEAGRDEGQCWGTWGLGRASGWACPGVRRQRVFRFQGIPCVLPTSCSPCLLTAWSPRARRSRAWLRGGWVWFIGVPVPFPDIYGVADSPLQVVHGGLPGPSRGHIHCHRGS